MSRDAYHHVAKAPAAGAPLVFAFHGTGGDEHQFTGLIGQVLPEAGIVSPRGDVSEYGANRFFRRKAEGVYDMDDLDARSRKMAGFIGAHREAHPAAPAYGLGYSNGANILAAVLFEAPELIDRAVLMHPLIPWTPAPNPALKGRKILITAGRRDPICPPEATRRLADWFRAQGADVETLWHPGGHEIAPEEITAAARFLAPRGGEDRRSA